MTKQLTAPFRYDHVGSFLRPKALKEARTKFQNNEITYDELKKVEDEEIIRLIAKEKEAGVLAITDGEFRRSWWHFDFLGGLEGMEYYEKERGLDFHNLETRKEGVRVVGKIDFGSHPFLDHFKFIREHAGDSTVKFTIPSPNMLHARADKNPEIYPDEKELVEDTIKAYQKAIQAFYDAGCRYLQLDDTSWASLFSEESRAKLVAEGKDPQQFLNTLQYVINETTKNKPADMTITMHICRGNYKSTFFSSGGYNYAAEVIFGGLNVDGLFLEFDDERSGSFEVLKHVNRPDLKIVLGLITSKFGELENKEAIKARIQEAAKYVSLNQLCLSPQCGFSSTEDGNILEEENQWQKLALVKEIAEEIWG
ncbi:5-methyltetrahydropteroyltriglutamate--homocysteine S-methyltransferase [Lysinibacillus telephonicus]|uniref:5-methyltetrahydropteroyltriglutamate--homocysteine S-methyltransferase n=1 Tax=Lysinibacillus telephonicus TaxID=1714840 RepID=A0A3S0HDM9_9BACI|nr:5-methyltetrahydropteroyltriglutamate--homocysteine S-methyltransferase [Lysinibacillus telephonicus]RTQ89022.1 5-methyltetrahydropteroyltriglutamate--homocysteine S-methyltransferase [Lysinibacillus telephonicus]